MTELPFSYAHSKIAIFTFGVLGAAAPSVGQQIYWSHDGAIKRANLDGSQVETVVAVDGAHIAYGLAIDPIGEKLYWTGRELLEAGGSLNNVIRRSNLDGTNRELLHVDALNTPFGHLTLDVPNTKMYWSAVDHDIWGADTNGANAHQIMEWASYSVTDLAVGSGIGKLYWADLFIGRITRANFDGSNMEDVILSGDGGVTSVAFDGPRNAIYYSFTSSGGLASIRRANADGSNSQIILTTGVFQPWYIEVDSVEESMFWWDLSQRRFKRANLDGSGLQTILAVTHGDVYDFAIAQVCTSLQVADCDGDGIPDGCEADCDGDGQPNACGSDCDVDGIPDECEADCDEDNVPDDCEIDSDSDGTPDECDDCPLTFDPSQIDTDQDGIGDLCDNCPDTTNPLQEDADSDGWGDACGCGERGDMNDDGDVNAIDIQLFVERLLRP